MGTYGAPIIALALVLASFGSQSSTAPPASEESIVDLSSWGAFEKLAKAEWFTREPGLTRVSIFTWVVPGKVLVGRHGPQDRMQINTKYADVVQRVERLSDGTFAITYTYEDGRTLASTAVLARDGAIIETLVDATGNRQRNVYYFKEDREGVIERSKLIGDQWVTSGVSIKDGVTREEQAAKAEAERRIKVELAAREARQRAAEEAAREAEREAERAEQWADRQAQEAREQAAYQRLSNLADSAARSARRSDNALQAIIANAGSQGIRQQREESAAPERNIATHNPPSQPQVKASPWEGNPPTTPSANSSKQCMSKAHKAEEAESGPSALEAQNALRAYAARNCRGRATLGPMQCSEPAGGYHRCTAIMSCPAQPYPCPTATQQ